MLGARLLRLSRRRMDPHRRDHWHQGLDCRIFRVLEDAEKHVDWRTEH